jgi:hypothetical protein
VVVDGGFGGLQAVRELGVHSWLQALVVALRHQIVEIR